MAGIVDMAVVAKDIFPAREFKGSSEPSFDYTSSITMQPKGASLEHVDTSSIDNKTSFENNLRYWNQEIAFSSSNNFDNSYFNRIVEMGREAVPFILEELKKGPTPLVHALDLIFPGTVEYNGYVPLNDVCDTWLSILKEIGLC